MLPFHDLPEKTGEGTGAALKADGKAQ